MNLQELYRRYPKIDEIVALGNENREHAPSIARLCDFVTGLCADLITYLPYTPPPAPVVVQTPRFDPYTGQPLTSPAPEPAQWAPPPVGTPGLSQGWPQPAPGVVVAQPAQADEKAEIRELLARLAAKL